MTHMGRVTRKHAAALSALACAASLIGAQPAAARSYDPNEPRAADPNRTCLSIPAALRAAAGDGDFQLAKMRHLADDFDHQRCLDALVGQTARIVITDENGVVLESTDPWAACADPDKGYTYPHTFGADGFYADQLPDLVANNTRQCGNALWATETLVSLLGGPQR